MRVPEITEYSRVQDRDGYGAVDWVCPECWTKHFMDHEITENGVRCGVCFADWVLGEQEKPTGPQEDLAPKHAFPLNPMGTITLAFEGVGNTGFYHPTPSAIAWVEDNTETMRVDSLNGLKDFLDAAAEDPKVLELMTRHGISRVLGDRSNAVKTQANAAKLPDPATAEQGSRPVMGNKPGPEIRHLVWGPMADAMYRASGRWETGLDPKNQEYVDYWCRAAEAGEAYLKENPLAPLGSLLDEFPNANDACGIVSIVHSNEGDRELGEDFTQGLIWDYLHFADWGDMERVFGAIHSALTSYPDAKFRITVHEKTTGHLLARVVVGS